MANPIRLDGIDMIDTQPVWRPKYMLAEHITVPTPRPAATPRTVKLRPWGDGEVIIANLVIFHALEPFGVSSANDEVLLSMLGDGLLFSFLLFPLW
jgi:hypothetical protein